MTAGGNPDNNNWWIGLSDIGREKDWFWMNSKALPNYFNWAAGEPDGSSVNDQDCVGLVRESDYFRWADFSCCSARMSVVCEADDF